MLKGMKQVINAVKVFGENWDIPLDQITIGGGGALILMGVRAETNDLNVWVDSPYFEKLAESQKTPLHPLRDTGIKMPNVNTYVRKRNRYFGSETIADIEVFDTLALMVQKRGGYAEHERPVEKRKQDLIDIKILNELMSYKNRVATV